ncbi:MAG: excinuclease ABC subunit UvrA [Chthoniobacterales bacterium]|nr:excinuclease ABC subunit UvrA [Chthoniobacterales bacterium]
MTLPNSICIRGARQHNLKNIDLTIPKNKLVVITGPSGSGKSSLALDTLFAEGQRRYVESLSTNARLFLERLPKPDVDLIEGLSPAIAIRQHQAIPNARSTIATVTELDDYIRLLFSSIGTVHDPETGEVIRRQSKEQIVEEILKHPAGTRLVLLAPLLCEEEESYELLLNRLRRQGFMRVRIDQEIVNIDSGEAFSFSKNKDYQLEAIVDRLILNEGIRPRLHDSLGTALSLGKDRMLLLMQLPGSDEWGEKYFSTDFCNPKTGFTIPPLLPKHFSFNSIAGACPACHGLGKKLLSDSKEISEPCSLCHGRRLRSESLAVTLAGKKEENTFRSWNICELEKLTIQQARQVMNSLQLTDSERAIVTEVVHKVEQRLFFLEEVGLGYLTLDRESATLSGGEWQRIRLATQVGSALSGVLYVLDEPSIGLHPRDGAKLLKTLHHLRDLGNSVIVIEHDEATMRAADYIVDLGPGAGVLGGSILAQGTPKEIIANPESLTGRYLSGSLPMLPSPQRHEPQKGSASGKGWLSVVGATEHNLKNLTVSFPLGLFTCITGVSGSGKSTLINEILYPALAHRLYGSKQKPGKHEAILGAEQIDKVIVVDQSPIGRTPRSNPATYAEIFGPIRTLFATLPAAKMRGLSSNYFSCNVKGGRCEHCKGEGIRRVEMHFLADVFVSCEVCEGRRFQREALEITFKGRSIADVLEMTIEEALLFFRAIPSIVPKLECLKNVGLGYLKLGQSATTLSGGEAQRLKLSVELSKRDTGKTLYLLDEPTTGLHFVDVQKLLAVLFALRDRGNTLLVIEHHLEVMRSADWIIDLGPEGGDAGGQLVAAGTPESVAACPESLTGAFLKCSRL